MTLDLAGNAIRIRSSERRDVPFLEEMLFEAFHWDPTMPRPRREEFLHDPDFRKLLLNWGRPGDAGLVATYDEKPVGAGWFRLWTNDEHSYGFVDDEMPELSLGVREEYRSRGIGRQLLQALVSEANRLGFGALSLSVDPSNVALQLYESEGFFKIGEEGTSWTLMRSI